MCTINRMTSIVLVYFFVILPVSDCLRFWGKPPESTTPTTTTTRRPLRRPVWFEPPMQYLDEGRQELFFDRIVFIALEVYNETIKNTSGKNIAMGVFINTSQVLTSWNPFREFAEDYYKLRQIHICYIYDRWINTSNQITNDYECDKIACGRPIIPAAVQKIRDNQWHGTDYRHSPLHDLMVLKIDRELKEWYPGNDTEVQFHHLYNQYIKIMFEPVRAGPTVTDLATPKERLGRTFTFVSLGLYSLEEVYKFRKLEIAEFEDDENVITDCSSWLPRNWGNFYCIKTTREFAGFASSSMLFYDRKLFGVGSFTLWRGRERILVFTDVRPYINLIYKTCSDEDSP